MEGNKTDGNDNCLDVVVDVTTSNNSINSEKFLKPRKSINDVLSICLSRTEIRHMLQKYRCLIFSSVLALIGLVISIQMVRMKF